MYILYMAAKNSSQSIMTKSKISEQFHSFEIARESHFLTTCVHTRLYDYECFERAMAKNRNKNKRK